MQTILIILGIYLLYKFIADFVIPIYRTTKRLQAQFRSMQQQATRNPATEQHNFKATTPKPSSNDYIEFEEIKD